MTMQLDLEKLIQVAMATGALSGNPQALKMLGQKEAALTLSSLGSMYGCCGLFDACGSNDLLSLTLESEKFLDWIGWRPDNQCRQFIKLLTYIGPSGTAAGVPSAGTAGACDDAYGVEFGTCEILLPDKGRLKRAGPVRDLTEDRRVVCDEYPVFMKDGTRITSELIWSLTLAGTAIKQDLKRLVLTGNSAVANQFAGLQQLVNTGYQNATDGRRCSAMDSIVIDWNSQPMASPGPNGVHNLVDYLIDAVRRIRQRASWSNLGESQLGDFVLMMPSHIRDCLLDAYTCWSVCTGTQYNETVINTFEGRQFRTTLNGGMWGDGQIFVDGRPIPIITYDWQVLGQAAPHFIGDIYGLTRRIGNVPTLWGQFIDMTDPAAGFTEQAGYQHYRALDGGRFLGYWKTDNECTQATLVFRPNLYMSAPWACFRIQDVACARPLVPISPDPTSSYYAEEYLAPAYCPEDYLEEGI